MPLSRGLREFIECLNSKEVEYLVVGALAVSWHGFPRYSADIDFLIRPSHPNAERVLRAIVQFGFRSLDISIADLTVPGKVIQLGFEPNRIDLMTSVTGVTFDAAGDDRSPGILDGLPVISSGDRLSSVTRTPLAAPRTASTPRNSGSRNHRRSFPVLSTLAGPGDSRAIKLALRLVAADATPRPAP
jgi:hypothetical protein